MLLSTPFFINNEEFNKSVDEFDILYDNNSNPNNLKTFRESYPEQKLNILFDIKNENDIVSILETANINNFAIVSKNFLPEYLIEIFKKKQWDYYILAPARNFYELNYYFQQNVSDVYIADELWHNLKRVRVLCGNHTRIRLVADQSSSLSYEEGTLPYYTQFVPRPEDFNLLSKYVDVIQFTRTDKDKIKTLYDVWFKYHKWEGYTRDIIFSDSIINLPNGRLLPGYTESKIRCGARCLNDERCTCRKCKTLYELAKSLNEKGMKLTYERMEKFNS